MHFSYKTMQNRKFNFPIFYSILQSDTLSNLRQILLKKNCKIFSHRIERRGLADNFLFFMIKCIFVFTEMICLETQFFKINRFLLLAIGLWPHQRSKLTQVQFIILFSILITFITFQVFTTFQYLRYYKYCSHYVKKLKRKKEKIAL